MIVAWHNNYAINVTIALQTCLWQRVLSISTISPITTHYSQTKVKAEIEFQLAITGVGVEKVDTHKNGVILGDRKCLGDPRKSFVGHPDATQFGTSSRR
jgi:PIN domain nuclease of toxin-antitoxin system